MKYTDPQYFGTYEKATWPLWPFYVVIAATALLLYFNNSLALLGILTIIVLYNKKNYLWALSDATDTPVPPAIGQANIRATFTRRVVKYRGFLGSTVSTRTQLVVMR
jgi:hypothetical protein